MPYTTPPGNYRITYSVTGRSDHGISDSDSFTLVVLPEVKLELLIQDKPNTVIAGETYPVKILLLNKGNGKSEIQMDVIPTPNYPFKIQPSAITLGPGESQTINIEITTDRDLREVIRQVIVLNASVGTSGKDIVSLRKTVSVDIIPRVTGERDPYHRVPARLSFIGMGEGDEHGYQMEFSGSGSLDEEGKKSIEFFFRGPDTSDKTIFGTREELSVNYFSETLTLRLGDNSYSLSHMTDMYKYGRGAELNYHPGKFGAGAFYMKEIWSEPEIKETGTYLTYQLNDRFNIKANYLNIQEDVFTDNIYSLQTAIKPYKNIELDLEYGLSSSDRESASWDHAYRIASIGEFSNEIRYSFNKIRAGSDYYGYYNDSDILYSTIAFPVYNKLRGHLSLRTYKNNLDYDPSLSTANREETYRTGLSYSFSTDTDLSLEYNKTFREDELLPADYDYEETSLKLGLTQSFRRFSAQAFIEKGEFADRLNNTENKNLERYRLYLYYNPTDRQSYSLYYNMGHDSFTSDPQRKKSASVSMNLEVTRDIFFYLRYAKDNFDSMGSQEQESIDSTFKYTLPNRHFLSFRYRLINSEDSGENESSYIFVYSIPLQIPVGKKKAIGTVKGRVFDRELPGNPPISNVIIQSNQAAAVTDQNGEFIFPSLRPGTYSLWVDRNSIGLHRVTEEKLPVQIKIQGGETIKTDIGVVNSCSISGRVILFKTDNYNLPVSGDNPVLMGSGEYTTGEENTGLKNILVQISNGGETMQSLTNENGIFAFDDIRPGKWKVKMYPMLLPAHHYIDKEEFEVDLEPGEERNILTKVLPRQRPIRMIEEGEIISIDK